MVICGSRRDDEEDLLKSIERLNQQKQGTAFHHVRENIDDLNGRVGARDTDLIFLKGLMQSPIMSSLVKLQDRLEVSNRSVNPVATGNQQLVKEVRTTCRKVGLKEAQELADILSNPHFGSMLDAHDIIATKSYDPHNESLEKPSSFHNNSLGDPSGPTGSSTSGGSPTIGLPSETIRLVGIRKNEDEPLGITVKVENDNLLIARILAGGIIDRQGLLHVGDTILEVNGVDVHTPEQLSAHLKKAHGSVTFKIMPSFHDTIPPAPCYLKALYSYDPAKDTLLPCKEIGLKFHQGDILQILNQEDPNWWQARRVGVLGPAGLIPSQELEERRRAFVRPEFDYATKTGICGTRVTKKKRKTMYLSKANADFDKAELLLYEEVARMPPFERKTLVLVGAQGVGRRSLKTKLIASDPRRFSAPLPHTSRPIKEDEIDGKSYFFVTRESMDADIAENKYLEWGEHGEHLYGTKLDSIRAIIRSGKMCILDCNPQSLKMLKTSEFMPYVVFIAAPHTDQLRQMHEYGKHHGYASMRSLTFERAMGRHGSRRARTLESLASIYEDEDLRATIEESGRLQRAYEKYFDFTLVNNNFDKTFEQLREAIDALGTEPQWVPVSWVY